jgi:uncharacterized LabA/DUF88 family protein
MLSFALLIDGGFIKRRIGTAKQPMTASTLQAFVDKLVKHDALANMRLHRIYFYDAEPLRDRADKPLQGGQVDFGATPLAQRSMKLHEELKRHPFFALRMGELALGGWAVAAEKIKVNAPAVTIDAADLRPVIRQKGVDMRIGLDIASLTLKKLVDVIVLVTGDSDFVPAMKFARREGAQLYLVPLGHSVREGMHEHADLVLDVA